MLIVVLANNSGLFWAKNKHQVPYKKQKAIRSNKKDVIYDLMTDLGETAPTVTNDHVYGKYKCGELDFFLCNFAPIFQMKYSIRSVWRKKQFAPEQRLYK